MIMYIPHPLMGAIYGRNTSDSAWRVILRVIARFARLARSDARLARSGVRITRTHDRIHSTRPARKNCFNFPPKIPLGTWKLGSKFFFLLLYTHPLRRGFYKPSEKKRTLRLFCKLSKPVSNGLNHRLSQQLLSTPQFSIRKQMF